MLASAGMGGSTIAVHSSNVYWGFWEGLPGGGLAQYEGAIFSVPVCGGTVTTLVTEVAPMQITADGTSVYWTDRCPSPNSFCGGLGIPAAGEVVKVPLGGGAITTIASGQADPEGIAVDATSVYWTNADSGVASLVQAPLGGGSFTTLATQQIGAPVNESLDYADSPGLFAIDGVNVYWGGPAAIYQVPVGGGSPVTLAVTTPDVDVQALAVDGQNVYWALQTYTLITQNQFTYGPTYLMKCAIGGCGGMPTTLASFPGTATSGLALDATGLYWSAGPLLRIPLDGGAVTTIASITNDPQAPAYPGAVAADATSVYWLDAVPAQIMRFTPN